MTPGAPGKELRSAPLGDLGGMCSGRLLGRFDSNEWGKGARSLVRYLDSRASIEGNGAAVLPTAELVRPRSPLMKEPPRHLRTAPEPLAVSLDGLRGTSEVGGGNENAMPSEGHQR
jgi:hypothetical protein